MKFRLLAAVAICALASTVGLAQQSNDSHKLAHDIFTHLIETNTTESVGNMTTAANEMAERLRAAGFSASDIVVLGPDARHGNIVARIHGTGVHKPMLFLAHLDVVEANRSDWSVDPFKLTEKDGWKPPKDFKQFPEKARQWCKENADTYVIKRFDFEKSDK